MQVKPFGISTTKAYLSVQTTGTFAVSIMKENFSQEPWSMKEQKSTVWLSARTSVYWAQQPTTVQRSWIH